MYNVYFGAHDTVVVPVFFKVELLHKLTKLCNHIANQIHSAVAQPYIVVGYRCHHCEWQGLFHWCVTFNIKEELKLVLVGILTQVGLQMLCNSIEQQNTYLLRAVSRCLWCYHQTLVSLCDYYVGCIILGRLLHILYHLIVNHQIH